MLTPLLSVMLYGAVDVKFASYLYYVLEKNVILTLYAYSYGLSKTVPHRNNPCELKLLYT